MALLSGKEMAERMLSIVALAKQLQEHVDGTSSNSLGTLIHNLEVSLTALYSSKLLQLSPHLTGPSLTALTSFFQVLQLLPHSCIKF